MLVEIAEGSRELGRGDGNSVLRLQFGMHKILPIKIKEIVPKFSFIKFFIKLNFEFLLISKRIGFEQSKRSLNWVQRGFDSPAPNFVKWNVMMRWGSKGTWIETGTYLGETTDFLSQFAAKVISIEPSSALALGAKKRFKNRNTISIVQGTSEDVLREVLIGLDKNSKNDINFWLDGHYSEGITYLGKIECPVIQELEIIESFLEGHCEVTVLIDDVRSFSPTGENRNGYPSLTYLANWANQNQLKWTIEHDIFVITNRVS